eukprot:g3603.t1
MANWQCRECPLHASCDGLVTWSSVEAKFGNWRDTDDNKFYSCLRPQSCLGAPNDALVSRFPREAAVKNSTEGCAHTFTGRLCATCKKGYARSTKRGSCSRCQEPGNTLLFISAGVAGLVGTCVLIRITVFKPREVHFSDGVKKIFLSYLQLASLASAVNVPWTASFRQLFAIQQISTSIADAFLSLDCVLEFMPTWNVFLIKLFGVLLLPVLVLPIAYVAIRFCCKRFRSNDSNWVDQFVATVVLLWYLAFPSIVQKLTMLITCTEEINGVQYVVVDPEIVCWGGEHRDIALVAGLFGLLAYVVGLPLLGVYVLKTVDRSTSGAQLRYGILYDGYSKQFWYWEITVVLRKLAIILIGSFLDGQEQILSILLVLFLVIYFTATCQPFENVELLRLELVSLAVCFITFWIGSLFLEESSKCSNGEDVFCKLGAVVVIVLNVVAAVYLAGIYLQEKVSEKKEWLMKWYRRCNICGCCCMEEKEKVRRESLYEMVSDGGDNGIGEVNVEGEDMYHEL